MPEYGNILSGGYAGRAHMGTVSTKPGGSNAKGSAKKYPWRTPASYKDPTYWRNITEAEFGYQQKQRDTRRNLAVMRDRFAQGLKGLREGRERSQEGMVGSMAGRGILSSGMFDRSAQDIQNQFTRGLAGLKLQHGTPARAYAGGQLQDYRNYMKLLAQAEADQARERAKLMNQYGGF